MAERIEWHDDGTPGGSPFSPRFGDRYRSELGGMRQAREVFLHGCGLPGAWAGRPQWCILETGFGLGLNFLLTWQAWKADPQRPGMLHFVSLEAFPASRDDVLRAASSHPELAALAAELHQQLWGLLPGLHRLVFEGGQVLLTLCIGDAKAMLRQQSFDADSVYLDGFSPDRNPDLWDLHTFKALGRCCRRGTRIATWTVARSVRDALTKAGFIVRKSAGSPPKRDRLEGEFNPAWKPKKPKNANTAMAALPARCVVIGAGLAGAAVAASLARRGWQVTVLDALEAPAGGASGLPAGVLATHVSPDDSTLSRLSRSGVRATLQQANAHLKTGVDWNPGGVLERCLDHPRVLPAAWQGQAADAASDWVSPASAAQLAECGLPASDAAIWHVKGGWIRPASLVTAWLSTPGVQWRGRAEAAALLRQGEVWRVVDKSGHELASAEMVVLAAGPACRALGLTARLDEEAADLPAPAHALALQPIRGQVSWAPLAALEDVAGSGSRLDKDPQLPPFAVNGHGSLIPAFPYPGGKPDESAWLVGSTFERDGTDLTARSGDDDYNLARLRTLLPVVAGRLTGEGSNPHPGALHSWTGVRCATPSRLPAIGSIDQPGQPPRSHSLWVCSGLGSRGLTFAALCGELLAARLHAEPLPITQRLADTLLPAFEACDSPKRINRAPAALNLKKISL